MLHSMLWHLLFLDKLISWTFVLVRKDSFNKRTPWSPRFVSSNQNALLSMEVSIRRYPYLFRWSSEATFYQIFLVIVPLLSSSSSFLSPHTHNLCMCHDVWSMIHTDKEREREIGLHCEFRKSSGLCLFLFGWIEQSVISWRDITTSGLMNYPIGG